MSYKKEIKTHLLNSKKGVYFGFGQPWGNAL